MADPQERAWTLDEFFAWSETQSDRYELVDGRPQRLGLATNVHDDIVVNLLTSLASKLRGSGRRVFSGSGAVETYPGQIRRPDLGVDCGASDPDGYKARTPCLVVEVMSPFGRSLDDLRKLGEYLNVGGLFYIAAVQTDAPCVVLHSRGQHDDWLQCRVEGLDADVQLPAVGAVLSMREIYEGVEFAPQRRLMTERPT